MIPLPGDMTLGLEKLLAPEQVSLQGWHACIDACSWARYRHVLYGIAEILGAPTSVFISGPCVPTALRVRLMQEVILVVMETSMETLPPDVFTTYTILTVLGLTNAVSFIQKR